MAKRQDGSFDVPLLMSRSHDVHFPLLPDVLEHLQREYEVSPENVEKVLQSWICNIYNAIKMNSGSIKEHKRKQLFYAWVRQMEEELGYDNPEIPSEDDDDLDIRPEDWFEYYKPKAYKAFCEKYPIPTL